MTIQLTPGLTIKQDMHYVWGLIGSYRQADFNAQLLGMLTPQFGLSIVYKEQYDNSMPAPVNRTLRSHVSGVQVKL